MTYAARAEIGIPTQRDELPLSDLAHIPGEEGWPVIGNTFRLLADPKGEVTRMVRAYGPVYRNRAFGRRIVQLTGPEANEFVLFDRQKLFSSREGWGPFLDLLFPRGLMLLDFDEHRLHRKALSVAFKTEPMRTYLDGLNEGLAVAIDGWLKTPGEFKVYPAMKQLTLDLAAVSFFGRDLGADKPALNRAFVDMVAAAIAPIRKPLPGTSMARGVKGRRVMTEYLARELERRRGQPGGDLFTQLCNASTDEGRLLSPQEIVDHMNFFMMAAHDTLTSSLSAFVGNLAADPDWQERLRGEIEGLGLPAHAALPYDRLDDLPLVEMAFKETLRLMPPVSTIPRRVMRDTQFKGFSLPAGTRVSLSAVYTHYDPAIWPQPEKFDPYRFTEANARGRHKYAYVPYGGGAHMCLGLNFAVMQAKAFAFQFLRKAHATVQPGYKPSWQIWPIPKPRDGLIVAIGRAA